jgi:hypothetical protein
MKRFVLLGSFLAALATFGPSAHAGDVWHWLLGILMPPTGFAPGTGPGLYTIEGYFTPETFGESCDKLLGGCVNDPCGHKVHFYAPSKPMPEIDAVRLYQIGKSTTCYKPVVQPPIPGLN